MQAIEISVPPIERSQNVGYSVTDNERTIESRLKFPETARQSQGSEAQLVHEVVSGNSGNHPRPFNIVPDYYPDMIQDARFLRAGFVPSEVVHRDPEVNHLSSVLEPLARGETADTALITGPTGSGKTCIAKFTEGTPPGEPRRRPGVRQLLGGPHPISGAVRHPRRTRTHRRHSPPVDAPRRPAQPPARPRRVPMRRHLR